VKGSTLVVVGLAGLVAAAAVVSGVRSAVGGGSSGGGTATTGATAGAGTAGGTTAPTDTLPVGDVRRLPRPRAGALGGTLVVYSAGLCLPVVIDLARLVSTSVGTMGSACSSWVSPDGRRVAMVLPPPEDHHLMLSAPIAGRPDDTGLAYSPDNTGALTVTDDGTVATCDGRHVIVAARGRARTVRSFTPADNGFDERCVTGALGAHVVRLSDDRRSLVDAIDGSTVRRLARPVRQPIVAIATSPDGYVLIADTADGTPQGTVYGPDGAVAIPRRPIGRGTQPRKVVLARRAVAVALQSSRGWDVTSLRTGSALVSPGGARITDIAFAPDASVVAAATEHGVLFATLPGLVPRSFLALPSQGVEWYPASAFPDSRTSPVRTVRRRGAAAMIAVGA
jgi:hypothetical protein